MRKSRSTWAGLLVLSASLVAGCSIKPVQPDQRAPAPLPDAQNSVLTVPVSVTLATLRSQIDSLISPNHGAQSFYWTTGERIYDSGRRTADLQVGVHRSGPTTIQPDGGCLKVTVPMAINSGRIDTRIDNHSPIPDVRTHFEFGGGANVTVRVCLDVQPDWNVASTVQTSFTWSENPWVEVGFGFGSTRVHLGGRVGPRLQSKLPEINARVSELLSNLPLRSALERAWVQAHNPLSVSTDPEISAEIEPIALGVRPFETTASQIVVTPSLVAKLRVHAGRGAARPATPLPQNTVPGTSSEIALALRADAPYTELNGIAARHIAGKAIDLDHGRSVTPKSIVVSPLGDKLQVRVEFDAKLHWLPFLKTSGWLYLVGTPRYDDDRRRISVEDLDYDLKTKNLLIESAEPLLHAVVLEKLRQALVFDVSAKVDPLRRKVETGLMGVRVAQGVTLNGVVRSLAISDIHVGGDGVGIYGLARGTASLNVDLQTP